MKTNTVAIETETEITDRDATEAILAARLEYCEIEGCSWEDSED